jgi:hypothetical protein
MPLVYPFSPLPSTTYMWDPHVRVILNIHSLPFPLHDSTKLSGGVKHRCPGERRPASSAHGRGASSGDRLPARSVHGEDQAASGGEWLPARGEPRHWGTSGANSGAAATALAPPTGAHCGRR